MASGAWRAPGLHQDVHPLEAAAGILRVMRLVRLDMAARRYGAARQRTATQTFDEFFSHDKPEWLDLDWPAARPHTAPALF